MTSIYLVYLDIPGRKKGGTIIGSYGSYTDKNKEVEWMALSPIYDSCDGYYQSFYTENNILKQLLEEIPSIFKKWVSNVMLVSGLKLRTVSNMGNNNPASIEPTKILFVVCYLWINKLRQREININKGVIYSECTLFSSIFDCMDSPKTPVLSCMKLLHPIMGIKLLSISQFDSCIDNTSMLSQKWREINLINKTSEEKMSALVLSKTRLYKFKILKKCDKLISKQRFLFKRGVLPKVTGRQQSAAAIATIVMKQMGNPFWICGTSSYYLSVLNELKKYHNSGIIQGDLHRGNVLVIDKINVLIIDFSRSIIKPHSTATKRAMSLLMLDVML